MRILVDVREPHWLDAYRNPRGWVDDMAEYAGETQLLDGPADLVAVEPIQPGAALFVFGIRHPRKKEPPLPDLQLELQAHKQRECEPETERQEASVRRGNSNPRKRRHDGDAAHPIQKAQDNPSRGRQGKRAAANG